MSEQNQEYPAAEGESSLDVFLRKEEEGKATIHSSYDDEGTLCVSFTFDDAEAEYLSDLVIDCIEELMSNIRSRHEQVYEGMSTAEALRKAAEEEGGQDE